MESKKSNVRLGIHLRHARKMKGMTLSELSEQAQCSQSLLSKIENGKANPSLNMLHRIAARLDTNIAALFLHENEAEVVAKKETRPRIDIEAYCQGDGIILETLTSHNHNFILQAHIHIISPGGRTSEEGRAHEGEEVGYILEGVLDLIVDGETYHMEKDDSFVFRSELNHKYVNPGDSVCRVLWVNSPPTF